MASNQETLQAFKDAGKLEIISVTVPTKKVEEKSLAQKVVEIVMATLGHDYDSLDRQAGFLVAAEVFGIDYKDMYQVWLDQTYDAEMVEAKMVQAVFT